METDKHKKVLMKIDETNNLNRNETFTKSDRKRVTEKISKSNPRTEAGKTNFREVADRKRRTEDPVLSVPSSPLSWYIPSQSNSRSGSNNSELIEDSRHQACQANIRARASSVSNQQSFGWNGPGQQSKSKNRHFGQMCPSRQTSQDSDTPPSQCRGIQTGRSLLRMYLRKVESH